MSERWRPIPGFADYDVSDQGRVRSWKKPGSPRRQSEPRILKQTLSLRGYPQVSFSVRSKQFPVTVHRLVMTAFVGPLPSGLETRHLNGNPLDNRLSNLAYGTPSENIFDQVRHGTHPQAAKTHCPRNHAYDEQNTEVRYGRRFCLACRLLRDAERTEQRRAAARLARAG